MGLFDYWPIIDLTAQNFEYFLRKLSKIDGTVNEHGSSISEISSAINSLLDDIAALRKLVATREQLGMIRASDTVQVDAQGVATVPNASTVSAGVVKIGELHNDSGLQAIGGVLSLYPANAQILGGVKSSDDVSITNGQMTVNHATNADSATRAANADNALLAASATRATDADHADSASRADNADHADNATHADTADRATVAVTATTAESANEVTWADVTQKPAQFPPVQGSQSVIGGYKVGAGLSVSADGTLTADASGESGYTLPTATREQLGGVKIGDNINVTDDGTISATAAYNLPIAGTDTLGGVMVGNGLTIDAAGKLSTTGGGGTEYTLPTASADTLGGVKIGDNIRVTSDGTISTHAPYVLPVATDGALGGVMSGGDITVAPNGAVTVSHATGATTATTAGTATFATTAQTATRATTADSVAWDAVTGKPSAFPPPIAAASALGGVLSGGDISVSTTGAVTVSHAATATTATTATTANGVAWTAVTGKPATFAPPVATTTVRGGVISGGNITVNANNGAVTVNYATSAGSATTATTATTAKGVAWSGVSGRPTLVTASVSGSELTLTGV